MIFKCLIGKDKLAIVHYFCNGGQNPENRMARGVHSIYDKTAALNQ